MKKTLALLAVVTVGLVVGVVLYPWLQDERRRRLIHEAVVNLRRLFDASVSYYDTDFYRDGDAVRVCQAQPHLPLRQAAAPGCETGAAAVAHMFPGSAALSPPQIPCGEAVVAPPGTWDHPTWQALNFRPTEPLRYSYQYDSWGTSRRATFVASAFADLDCDGAYATFVRVGTVDVHSTNRGFFVQDGLE